MTEKKPKVSVCVVTYNQEKYIRQCLQSIVDQKPDFDFEVIVGDDCSTDGTKFIVQEFAQKYPHRVKAIFQRKNTGASKNYINVHATAIGEYVAHVDGDDFLLPGKLQAQTNYLDSHKECNIVWHRMYSLSKCGEFFEDNFTQLGMTKCVYFVDELVTNITVGLHSSKMYRRNSIEIGEMKETDLVDFAINIYQLQQKNSYAAFISDVPYGVYRLNIGISTQTSKIRKIIYQWLFLVYKKRMADRSIINAKVAWMILSDLKHTSGSIFIGISIFLKTIKSINFKAILKVHLKTFPSSIKFREIHQVLE